MSTERTRELVKFLAGFGKPVLGSSFHGPEDSMVKEMRRGGIPMYPGPERAVKAMAALHRYKVYRDRSC